MVNHLVPELQRRGVYPTAYKPGTLREKLFGADALLPANHPAARFRDIERVKREDAAQDGHTPATPREVETIK